MAKSVKVNFVFNLFNNISGILFPLITFPYVSRILMADGIGQINFFISILSYISLFTCLGIPLYAIKEIAKVRDNKEEMSRTTIEILLLHTALSFCGYFVVALLCMTVAEIRVDIPLFLILSLSIIFTALGCEWFYSGIEEFKYITIRNLLVKILYVILLFAFVRNKNDLHIYGILTILGTVGNNAFNFIYLRKFINIKPISLSSLHICRHLRPSFKIFVLNLIISIYSNLDLVMLGFMKNVTIVGYYAAATKIVSLFQGISGSLRGVMLPRFSYLFQNGQVDTFNQLAQRVMDFTLFISLPLTCGIVIMSPILIRIFCGESFLPAITTLQIISPILLAISISAIIGIQILYPQNKEKIVIISTAIGAITNLGLNIILIPYFGNDGAAIATVVAETLVTISMIIMGRMYIPLNLWSKHYQNCILGSAFILVVCYFVYRLATPDIVALFLIPTMGGLVYLLFMYIVKDEFLKYMIATTKEKIYGKKNSIVHTT